MAASYQRDYQTDIDGFTYHHCVYQWIKNIGWCTKQTNKKEQKKILKRQNAWSQLSAQVPECKINDRQDYLTQRNEFEYLDHTVTSDGKEVHEIKRRLAFARGTFNKMQKDLKNKNTNLNVKMDMSKTFIWPPFLYQ